MLDVLLVTVTVVSLVLAGVMAVFWWRVLQLDRRRSDVRVASLRRAASEMTMVNGGETRLTERPTSYNPAGSAGADPSGAPPELFSARASSSGAGLFVAVAIASVVFMAVAAAGLMLSTRGRLAEAETSPAPTATHAIVPLELLALDHVRDGSHLAIRGLVKNPAGASTMKDIVAVAYLFDRTGGHVGITRAPIVETVLEPGAESRFEIPVPDAQPVGRYRVTFQMSLAPVPHVDRRTAPGTEASPASRVAFGTQGRGDVTVVPAVR